MKAKATYPTLDVQIGTTTYNVHLRVQPAKESPHVGADSPRHMKPGLPRGVSIVRILRDGEDASDLFWATRKAIEKQVAEKCR